MFLLPSVRMQAEVNSYLCGFCGLPIKMRGAETGQGNRVQIPNGKPPLYALRPCSLVKTSHWGNLRRQNVDAGDFSIGVSQKTYKENDPLPMGQWVHFWCAGKRLRQSYGCRSRFDILNTRDTNSSLTTDCKNQNNFNEYDGTYVSADVCLTGLQKSATIRVASRLYALHIPTDKPVRVRRSLTSTVFGFGHKLGFGHKPGLSACSVVIDQGGIHC